MTLKNGYKEDLDDGRLQLQSGNTGTDRSIQKNRSGQGVYRR